MNEGNDVMSQAKPAPSGGHANTAKQPWTVEVDVHLTKGCPDPVFEIRTALPTSNGNIVFNNTHRPGFNVNFNLIDDTGEGYAFPSQSKIDEACWSQLGTACPSSGQVVFKPLHVANGGMTLVVFNKNPSPAQGIFQYCLNVTKDGGANYCPLDPGGTNNNGPQS